MTRQTERLAEMVTALMSNRTPSEIEEAIEAREVSVEDAKREIVELFKQRRGQDLYYSDIAEALNLDFSTVIAACGELENEQVIEGGSNGTNQAE
jgi:hypothetical protein